jgi:competence protein ComEC
VTTPNGKMLKDLYDTPEILEGVQLTRLYRDWCDVVSKASKRTRSKGYEFSCIRADSASEPLEIGDLKINFVNPVNKGTETEPLLHKFGSAGKTINGNSVGVKIEYGKASILLCGDMNPPSEKVLLASCRDDALYSHVFKANHHGSHHFTTEFLDAINPWVTVVSSGDVPDYGHPRANLMGSLGHYAPDEIKDPLLFSTELAATFKKIPESKQKDKGTQLYETNTQGIIYVRTNGDWLATGRIFKKKDYDEGMIKSSWKWEAYAYDPESGRFLLNDLETYKS